MMVVPTSAGASGDGFAQLQQTTEPNMLMALAMMHQQGRFDSTPPDPRASHKSFREQAEKATL